MVISFEFYYFVYVNSSMILKDQFSPESLTLGLNNIQDDQVRCVGAFGITIIIFLLRELAIKFYYVSRVCGCGVSAI
jgi:hypothetical protein